jgi:sugar phosphate isomerase/epimerase
MKDYKKVADPTTPWGWSPQACTIGEGDVNQAACVEALRTASYNGFVAVEYEGPEDEATGVPKSVAVLKKFVG